MVTCKMGPGTFEAKIVPLASLDSVKSIHILRESIGPEIEKVSYLVLPAFIKKIRILKFVVPFLLAYYTNKLKCDLIIGYHLIPYAFYSYLASKLTNVPFACAQTGLDIQRFANYPIFKQFLKKVLKCAKFINVPGNQSKKFWTEFGIKENKINILHSTIDSGHWIPGDSSDLIYDFIFLGRLDPVKRVDLIIESFKLLISSRSNGRKLRLIIVGTGSEEERLKGMVKELQISEHVVFTGFISNPLLYLQKSKYLIMSSFTEGLPTAMMQAMSCGLIPVTNLTGNISDLVTDGITGIVHDGTNSWDICEKMDIALKLDEKIVLEMKKAAREIIIEKHSYNIAVSKWDQIISGNRND